jgi:Carbon starvation protein, predicted membrane protein
MNAAILVIAALCVFAIGYRFYGIWIANRVLRLDSGRKTPAETLRDDNDYQPTNKYVLFGHHFSAIAAAGPLLGPVLAAQFGFLPGFLWILIGAVLAGGVHDMIVLFASVRHNGQSLSSIAQDLLGTRAGILASLSILFILILTLAGLSVAVVKAMADSPWSTYTVIATIPIAIFMGIYLNCLRPGDIRGATLIGLVLLGGVLITGPLVAQIPVIAQALTLNETALKLLIPLYAIIAAALPCWLLLNPRGYLSTYLKVGLIAVLALGIFIVQPELQMPAVTDFINGNGPVIPGPVVPFLFITIACGALSGFHATIGTGTTPKLIADEKDILFVGYGAMLLEGFVAVMALIAACVMMPADYFAINVSPVVYHSLGMVPVHLPELQALVGENLVGRTGGAVSLAVGMATIFAAIPVFKGLMQYWYHFAIMFEAVFILAAVDVGTRVGRYLMQELLGRGFPRFRDPLWRPGVYLTSILFTATWGILLYTGEIKTLWPLFGMSNQLLAATALLLVTTLLIQMGRLKYAWVTAIPGLFMTPITVYAGVINIQNYLALETPTGYMLAAISVILIALIGLILAETFAKWYRLIFGNEQCLVKDPDIAAATSPGLVEN